MTIEVHIDRIVLDGLEVPPGQSRALGEAVRAELARLLGEAPRGTWRASRHARRIDVPGLRLGGHHTVSSLGEEIARCLGTGLNAPGGAR
ncbi:hypothetical protein ATK36_5936 [Amycolatopsis sulphurea]|uniref:Uncharacterized protein n=1 Tax=Amycolatopsis sulphurea TaxID=76022 RepID=A0A2A9FIX3_9PSEU|nr:hypothetical protein [Amycolatopsis sulphurea]PFG50691.1 hypothetical protein ATK36_5936 [Amycolatopsis sulphurea]